MRIRGGERLHADEPRLIPAGDFGKVALGLGAEPDVVVTFDDVQRAQLANARQRLEDRKRGFMSKGVSHPSIAAERPGHYLVTTRIRPNEGGLGKPALFDLAFHADDEEAPPSELVIGRDRQLEYRDPIDGTEGRIADLCGLNNRDTPNIADQHVRITTQPDGLLVASLAPAYETLIFERAAARV